MPDEVVVTVPTPVDTHPTDGGLALVAVMEATEAQAAATQAEAVAESAKTEIQTLREDMMQQIVQAVADALDPVRAEHTELRERVTELAAEIAAITVVLVEEEEEEESEPIEEEPVLEHIEIRDEPPKPRPVGFYSRREEG